MNWEDARDRTLTHWSALRDAIGTADPLDLLVEINVIDALCDKSREVAGEPFGYCSCCLFYQQFGGCREVSSRMSDRAAARDWEGLKALVDEFIAHLKALQIPAEALPQAG
jgi:hypothetical protein